MPAISKKRTKKPSKPKEEASPKEVASPFLIKTLAEAAYFFGVERRTVSEWMEKSAITRIKGAIPVNELAKWYVDRSRKHQANEEMEELRREAQRQANRKLVRVNQEAEGELVHKTLIAAVLRQVLAGARSRFEATPAEIASLLPVEIRDELLVSITNAVERICHSFATDGRDLIENLGNDE